MNKIIVRDCTKRKFLNAGIDFIIETNFDKDETVYKCLVAPCETQPLFKRSFRNVQVDETCLCKNVTGRHNCEGCKIKCYSLNFLVEQMVSAKWFSKDVQLIDINKYLEKIKNCIKIHCSLDNTIDFHFVKGKRVLGEY